MKLTSAERAEIFSGIPLSLEQSLQIVKAVEKILDDRGELILQTAAKDFRENAGPAWGGNASWLTTGTNVAEVAAAWVERKEDG